jgi:energy-converting hydrogenase Eha subunit B
MSMGRPAVVGVSGDELLQRHLRRPIGGFVVGGLFLDTGETVCACVLSFPSLEICPPETHSR